MQKKLFAVVTMVVFVLMLLSAYVFLPVFLPRPEFSPALAVACPATNLGRDYGFATEWVEFAGRPTKDQYEDDEAYSIYSAILSLEALGSYKYPASISNTTVNVDPRGPFEQLEDEPLQTALEAYGEINRKSWLLQRRFAFWKPYRLFTAEDRKRFDMVISFSAVGFNTNKTVAVVYMSYFGGPGGEGNVYQLKKKIGIWRVVKYCNCWVS